MALFAGAIVLPACEGVIHDGLVDPPAGSGGAAAGGASGTGGACVAGALPVEVQAFVASCSSCHGPTPLPGLPSLASYQGLTAASAVDPSQTNAERAVARVQNAANPMPPAGSPTPAAADVGALQGWIAAGYPMAACSSGGGGGGTTGSDPFAVAPTCTSQRTWSGGNEGSAAMNPGEACIGCHRSAGGEAPSFGIAGTLYPTGHEPDLCNGTNGAATGAKIVITDAQGKVITMAPNEVGNFTYRGNVAMPFQAAVTYMGRERRMVSSPPSGDCNSCHTATGTMNAPGRIVAP